MLPLGFSTRMQHSEVGIAGSDVCQKRQIVSRHEVKFPGHRLHFIPGTWVNSLCLGLAI